jgi:hypothetical protein
VLSDGKWSTSRVIGCASPQTAWARTRPCLRKSGEILADVQNLVALRLVPRFGPDIVRIALIQLRCKCGRVGSLPCLMIVPCVVGDISRHATEIAQNVTTGETQEENCGGYLAAKSTMQLAIITPKTHIITMGIAHSDLHMREPGILVTMTKQVSQP